MDKITAKHTAIAVILFFSLSLFFRLGSLELQPWDEGLYAIRAMSILETGNWIDQTEHSVGGLYSSTYPPLTVWMAALSMKVTEPVFAVRLFSALCGSLLLLLTFLFARRFFSNEMSVFTVIALAVTITWNIYSRQGMTDIPVLTFCVLCLWVILKLNETKATRNQIFYSAVFTLAFAAALMSKIIVSFLPLLFVVVLLFHPVRKTNKYLLLAASTLGICLALPWHYFMYLQYGAEFYNAFLPPHIYSAVENNIRALGVGYYINQLIISNPFFVLSIVLLAISSYRFKRITACCGQRNKFLIKTLLLWFALSLIVFSLSVTKMPHYLVYMIIPCVLLQGLLIESKDRILNTPIFNAYVFSILTIAFFWSISFELRQSVKALFGLQGVEYPALFFVGLSLILLLMPLLTVRTNPEWFNKKFILNLSYAILLVLVVRIIAVGMITVPWAITGAKKASEILERSNKDAFIYLYHEHNASDSLNPQLDWYTNGWISGKREDKMFIPISMPKLIIDIKSIQKTELLKQVYLLYYQPSESWLADAVKEEISKTRPLIYQSKNYLIFGTYHYNRKIFKEI